MTDEIKLVEPKTLQEKSKRSSKQAKQIRFVNKKATPAESLKSSLVTSYFGSESSSESESGISSGSSMKSFNVVKNAESSKMPHLSSLVESSLIKNPNGPPKPKE
jgi:hypothetical protein